MVMTHCQAQISDEFEIEAASQSRSPSDRQSTPRVLVVDDDGDFADSLREILELEGFEVLVAADVDGAEQIANLQGADVALVDLLLGHGSGIDLVDRLQKASTVGLCVMMTAYASIDTAVKALQHGAYDYLRKPFRHGDLMATLDRCFERIRLQRDKLESEERYRCLYDETPSMFFTVDAQGTICSVNRYAAEQLGYEVADLINTRIWRLYAQTDQEIMRQYFASCLRRPKVVGQCEVEMIRKNGDSIWTRETGRVLTGHEPPKVLLACEDVSEARALSEKLTHQAHHDALTGLVNRREFERRLDAALQSSKTDNTEHALCYLDLDQFKIVNDTCGHLAGDELLRQLGLLLRRQMRDRDILARLGGDEFGVLLENCALVHAQRLAGTFRRVVSEFAFCWEGKSFSLGVSIGLVPITRNSGAVATVLSAADTACYAAKDDGRNRIRVFADDDLAVIKRHGEIQWVTRISRALEEDRFELYYQPITPVANVAGQGPYYEVLLRMRDERGRMVLPGVFLPAAERFNLSTRLDMWVVDATLKWLAGHPRHLNDLYLCAINLSGLSLADEGFREFVMQRLRATDVPPSRICFEVTETAAIANFYNATRFFNDLKDLGCKFSLDDFGSGLSSFGYLKNLPVDFLKIDGMFVKDIGVDPIPQAMVKSINEIGQAMGKKTVAEFVETQAILRELTNDNIGVDYVQGYAVGKPRALASMPVN